MHVQQEGIVIGIENDIAKVRTSRHSDCENCGSCPGSTALVLEARNPLGARPGQRVMIEVKELSMVKSAFVVYMLPLIAVFGGAMLGGYLAERLQSEAVWFSAGGGFLAFLCSLLYIKYFDRSTRKNVGMQPVITRILTD